MPSGPAAPPGTAATVEASAGDDSVPASLTALVGHRGGPVAVDVARAPASEAAATHGLRSEEEPCGPP